MNRSRIALALAGVLAAAVAYAAGNVAPTKDWPTWRGPLRDAKSTEEGLFDRWDAGGPPLARRIDNLGKGYSSVSISDGRIFTMGERSGSDQAELIALNVADGKELWATPVGEGSPNCTPTIGGDLVFALGREGQLVCARTDTGKVVWRKDFAKDFGGRMMSHWGYSESPLVDGDRLICTPGGDDAMIVALDKRTGETIWKSAAPQNAGPRGGDGAGYSSVVVSDAAGVKQYVQLTGRGLVSVSAADGKTLWSYNRVANSTANIPTPLVIDDYVFASSGYGTGAALLRITSAKIGLNAAEQYFLEAKEMQNHHGGMVMLGDFIYCGHGHNNGFPLCVEWKTGKVAWNAGRGPGSGSAAVLYADGHLYFRYEDGTMALIEANQRKYALKGTFKLATHHDKSWPHPVIVDGKLYIRDQQTLMCYDVAKK